MSWSPGVRVEGPRESYEIVGKLGEGGFAETWIATAPDGQRVVLKRLRYERLEDWKAAELFEREAKALAAIDHPRVPRYRDYFPADDEGACVLVQGFVDGEPLSADHRFDPAGAERLLRGGLEILRELHALHPPVIHRDLTPHNVIVDAEGFPHLVDFGGVADRLRREDQPGSTSVGTFGYMPLEQTMGSAVPASDLYSLGVTVVEALTGTPVAELPKDPNTSRILVEQLDVPPKLRPTLRRMTAPALGDRCKSADEALALLDGRATPAAPMRRKPLWISVGALAGVAAALIYTIFFDSLSETMLIRISALWLLPLIFAVTGALHDSSGSKRPAVLGLAWTGGAGVLLILFFEGMWSAL
jgi:serine/threonine protein kinase